MRRTVHAHEHEPLNDTFGSVLSKGISWLGSLSWHCCASPSWCPAPNAVVIPSNWHEPILTMTCPKSHRCLSFVLVKQHCNRHLRCACYICGECGARIVRCITRSGPVTGETGIQMNIQKSLLNAKLQAMGTTIVIKTVAAGIVPFLLPPQGCSY